MAKPRHRIRTLPVPSASAVDLFLLAGLPHPLHSRMKEYLQSEAGADAKVISTSSPSYDGRLYSDKTVQALTQRSLSLRPS